MASLRQESLGKEEETRTRKPFVGKRIRVREPFLGSIVRGEDSDNRSDSQEKRLPSPYLRSSVPNGIDLGLTPC